MKLVLSMFTFILSGAIYAAPPVKNSPIKAKTLERLRQNVCADVVSFAKDEGLKKYRMSHCLKTLEVSYVDEVYNVDPNAPVQFKILFQDDYAKELIKTEQWVMCEIFLTEPLVPENYEFSYCSIEG